MNASTDVVAAGALLQLGTVGVEFFAAHGIPFEKVVHTPFQLWDPGDCPLCGAGTPVESVAQAA